MTPLSAGDIACTARGASKRPRSPGHTQGPAQAGPGSSRRRLGARAGCSRPPHGLGLSVAASASDRNRLGLPPLSLVGNTFVSSPLSVGHVCDVPGSWGALPVTCLMASRLISTAHEEPVRVIVEAEILWEKLSP